MDRQSGAQSYCVAACGNRMLALLTDTTPGLGRRPLIFLGSDADARALLRCAALCCAVLRCAALRCAALCCAAGLRLLTCVAHGE